MKGKAWLNLRHSTESAFERGLVRLGWDVHRGLTMSPGESDILVTWNRIYDGDRAARVFADMDLPVIVCENATWGNEFAGRKWYTMTRTYHNVSGTFPVGGPERFDALGVKLLPWKDSSKAIILPSRGIGPCTMRQPSNWVEHKRALGRIRPHPGQHPSKPLEDDLDDIGYAYTWGSGAAVRALVLGVRVYSDMPNWIAEQDNTDESRLDMFRRLAWAQWTHEEIEEGEPFRRLLAFRS